MGLSKLEKLMVADLQMSVLGGMDHTIDVLRSETRCIRLNHYEKEDKLWSMVVDTRIENLRHEVLLKSLLDVSCLLPYFLYPLFVRLE